MEGHIIFPLSHNLARGRAKICTQAIWPSRKAVNHSAMLLLWKNISLRNSSGPRPHQAPRGISGVLAVRRGEIEVLKVSGREWGRREKQGGREEGKEGGRLLLASIMHPVSRATVKVLESLIQHFFICLQSLQHSENMVIAFYFVQQRIQHIQNSI